MGIGIPTLGIKILLDSNPLKSRIVVLVRRLGIYLLPVPSPRRQRPIKESDQVCFCWWRCGHQRSPLEPWISQCESVSSKSRASAPRPEAAGGLPPLREPLRALVPNRAAQRDADTVAWVLSRLPRRRLPVGPGHEIGAWPVGVCWRWGAPS